MAAQWHDLLNVLFPEAEKYRIYPPRREMTINIAGWVILLEKIFCGSYILNWSTYSKSTVEECYKGRKCHQGVENVT